MVNNYLCNHNSQSTFLEGKISTLNKSDAAVTTLFVFNFPLYLTNIHTSTLHEFQGGVLTFNL